jgi:hypothetical protein
MTQGSKRTFKIQLSASFEGLVNQFKGLPHCWRDRLGGKCAAVDDLEDLIVQIYTKLAWFPETRGEK